MAAKQITEKKKKIQNEGSEVSDIFLDVILIYIMLPKSDLNIVGYSRYLSELTETQNWQNAKQNFDFAAADRVINQIWTQKKTEKLRNMHADSSALVLLTVPSTTRQNAVPIQLAKKISTALKTKYIVGDQYFTARHESQSKNIPRLQRVFHDREYTPFLKNIDNFKNAIKDKKIIVIEDVLTTGGSVAKFIKALDEQGIKTVSVVGLMGDKRLAVDPKTQIRLNEALKNFNFTVTDEKIKSMAMTRTEAGGLIQLINMRRSHNAKTELAEKIRRLFGIGLDQDLGRNTKPAGNRSLAGADRSNGEFSERIQTRSVLGSGTGNGIKEIMRAFEKNKPDSFKKIKSYEQAIIRSRSVTGTEKNQALKIIYNYKKILDKSKGIGL